MNIKAMRNVHLNLGVFFTPLLTFFLISGAWQAFDLHQASRDGSYKPPVILKALSQVHKNQRWAYGRTTGHPSMLLRWLLVLMVIGLLVSIILGVVMAFKYTKPWIVWFCLFSGVALPVVLLFLSVN